tara:strand:+ start:4704 stop:5420 length:717 start_codon:yes stop_codon:yes gene_type:complete
MTSPNVRATVIFAQVNYVRPRATDLHLVTDLSHYFYYETMTLSDVATILTTKNRTDNFHVLDVAYFNVSKGVNNPLTMTDTVETVSQFLREFNDSITVQEAIGFIEANVNSFANTATITDLVGLHLSRPVTGDSFGFTDSVLIERGKGANETLTLSEAIELVMAFVAPISDQVNIADAVGMAYQKPITDAFVLDDATLINKDYDSTKGNVLSLTEQVSLTRTFGRTFGNNALNTTTLN